MKEKVLMLLACLWLGIGFSMAQAPKTVAGVVTSADDGEPIIGASVLVEGTTMGAITDVDGKFAINNVPADAKALIVSYLGMITQRVGIQRGTITVTMKSDTKVLDEVVVTAQGLNRKQKALGYSTQKVAGEDLTISRQTDLGNAMAGKVSGARFIGGASSGFDAGTIILRGAGSIPSSSQSDNPANEPIYVVDGAITNKNSINMDDVESINVLKGPAATALYGSRGGAGAIIITTKAGQSEKGLLEVSHTLQAETYYNHFNMQKLYGGGGYGGTEKGNRAQDIYDLYSGDIPGLQGAYVYDYNEDTSWGAAYDPAVKYVTPLSLDETSDYYGKPATWQHGLDLRDLYRTGVTNTTNVSFSKSVKDFNTRVSFTNSYRTGVQPNSDAIRRFLGFKTNFKPTPWMNVSLDYKYTYRQDHNAAESGYNGSRTVLQEYTQWGQTNVNLKDYKDYKRPDGSWRTWNINSVNNQSAAFHDNPYALFHEYNHRTIYQWNVFSGDVSVDLPYNLKAGVRVNGNIRGYKLERERPSGSINFRSNYRQDQSSLIDLTVQGRLTWGQSFFKDKLTVDAALFAEVRDYTYDNLYAYTNTNYDLSLDNYYNLAASSGTIALAYNKKTHYKERSVYATATMGWDDTYFLDASVRTICHLR